MKVAVEMSLYPLLQEYGPVILDFIARLNEYPELEVHTNKMSTQVFGTYDNVMRILTLEIKTTFEKVPTQVMVIKLINSGL